MVVVIGRWLFGSAIRGCAGEQHLDALVVECRLGFCHDLGLDYVSCSPYRIPIARLSAAQSALRARS